MNHNPSLRKRPPSDRSIISRFKKIGVTGPINTFEYAGERWFSITERDFAMVPYVPGGKNDLSKLAGELEDEYGVKVSIGPNITISSGPVRRLGCPVCDHGETAMHQNCVMR